MQLARLKLLIVVVLLFTSYALAQKNEIGALAGGFVPLGSTLNVSPGIAVEGVFAHRFFSVPLVSLYVELPVVVGFNTGVSIASLSASYSTLFIVPGLKLKLAPSFPLSPYFVLGGGYARFHNSNSLTGDVTSNKGAVGIGGGLDIKVFPYVSLRGEVRDFRTSSFSLLGLAGITGHNLVGAGGIVLRF